MCSNKSICLFQSCKESFLILSFDKCLHPWNHHRNQGSEHTRFPPKFPPTFLYSPAFVLPEIHLAIYRQPTLCLLSLWISLHFLEIYIKGINYTASIISVWFLYSLYSFVTHSWWYVYWEFILLSSLFYCWVAFYCMN